SRAEADTQDLLRLAAFPGSELQQTADILLLSAHSDDPMDKWVKLLRYASYTGWSKMRGVPLDCMWRRVAAEVLLRAHEDLAAARRSTPTSSPATASPPHRAAGR